MSDYLYLGHLSFAQLIIFLWMPFRLYYNLTVKPLIFGEKMIVSNFDMMVYLIVATILIITISILLRYKQFLVALISLVGLFLILALSFTPLNLLIDYSFGLNTIHETTWLLYPIFLAIILYIWEQILENWQS